MTGCLQNVFTDKSVLKIRDCLSKRLRASWTITQELTQSLATFTDDLKVDVSARLTVHPGGQAQIPLPRQMPPFWQGHRAWHFLPHAFSQLEGGEMESMLKNSLMDHFSRKHSVSWDIPEDLGRCFVAQEKSKSEF